jgi:hypothetical protein
MINQKETGIAEPVPSDDELITAVKNAELRARRRTKAVIICAIAPVMIGFTSFYPAWPLIVPLTALLEVVTLLVTYRALLRTSPRVVNRILKASVVVLCVGSELVPVV